MKVIPIFLLAVNLCAAQTITTQEFSENRYIISSNISLPAAKFHIAKKEFRDESKGFMELFSSFGVGMGINYGKARFFRDLDTEKVLEDETEFSNIIGMQFGVLYSSKLGTDQVSSLNIFSVYSALNILDLQTGVGYEFGSFNEKSTGWFVSVSYGIPIYKLTRSGSFILKERKRSAPRKHSDERIIANL